jgi:thiamine-phosphate pyrophosphorylase
MARSVDYSLYVILDSDHIRKWDLKHLIRSLCHGGASILQYRAKGEESSFHHKTVPPVIEVAHRYRVPVIINDETDLAVRYGADGVHLGQEDLPVTEARNRGGEDFIIGATVHNSEEARKAIEDGANYLSVGSIYHTETKRDIQVVGLDVLERICRIAPVPVIAIGGIDEDRIGEVLSRGVRGIAMVSAILDSADPGQSARKLRKRIDATLTTP